MTMPAISSRINSAQGDGRIRVRERHPGHLGFAHEHEHLAAIGLDTDGMPVACPAMTGVA
ncbi:hypothetical protein SAMN05216308_101425 [Nitrosospira sp. Nsp13]|nr:hypothetical protein SAMN05216308_101425 [Nitrosospira sp. Nsp13]